MRDAVCIQPHEASRSSTHMRGEPCDSFQPHFPFFDTTAGTMVNIVAVLGPVVLGIAFSLALFGVFTMQVWVYFIAFPKDRVWLKSMVSHRDRLEERHVLNLETGVLNVVRAFKQVHAPSSLVLSA